MTHSPKIGAPAQVLEADGVSHQSWPHDQAGAPMNPPYSPVTTEGHAAAPADAAAHHGPAGAQPYEIPTLMLDLLQPLRAPGPMPGHRRIA